MLYFFFDDADVVKVVNKIVIKKCKKTKTICLLLFVNMGFFTKIVLSFFYLEYLIQFKTLV